MKDSSKRTISRLVAFVMLVSNIFTNLIVTNAKIDGTTSDEVVSGSAVATSYKWSADDLAVETFTANPELGGEIFSYSIISGKSKVTGNAKTFADGSSFEQRLQMGAKGKIDSGEGVFTIEAPSAGQLYVYAVTGSNSDGRAVELYSADNVLIDSDVSGPIADASTYTYPVFVYDIAEAGTYKITSTSGAVNYYGMAFAAEGSVEEPTETTTEAVTETTTSAQPGEMGTPEAGKTYSADFAALTVGDKLNGWSTEDGIIKVTSTGDQAYVHDGQHGAALYDGDQISVAVAGNADVSLTLCQYGNGTEFVVTDSTGKVIDTVAGKGASDGEVVTVKYMGDPTVLTFTLAAAGEAYLHGVTAVNAAAPVGEAKSFEIWLDDMAVDGVVATKAYTGDVALTTGETVSLGDSILELQGQAGDQYTTSYGAAVGVIRDGKTVNGYKAGTRNANANDIATIPQNGDGCAIVFTPAATGTLNTYFVSTSFLRVWDFDTASGERYGYTDSEVAAESYGVKVEAGHTYVLSTTGKTNNMAYCGFEYVVDEPVTVSLSLNNVDANPDSIPNLEIYLTDAVLGGDPAATVKADTTSVDVAMGHTYIMSTNDGGVKATVAGSDRFTATGEAVVIDLHDIPDVTLTGEITGANEAVTALTFTNMVNGTVYTATITDNTYSVSLKPGDYDTDVETTNGAFTQDRVKVVQGEENVNEVYVEVVDPSKPATYGPADLFKLQHSEGVGARESDITAKPGDTITVPVAGAAVVTVSSYYQAGFTINGEGSYGSNSNSTSQIDSYTVNTAEGDTSVVITFTDSYNDTAIGTSYLTSISVVPVTAFKSEINVPGDYATLTDAVAAIKGMADRPDGEDGRVTINMTADIEEQVVFDAPYITLNGNGHTLSWYYGVGSFYYSIDESTGLYSESLYRDKYSSAEGNGNLWGGVAIIRGNNFITHDTTFLNTYNYYVTEKEASDVAYSVASMPERKLGADVTVYASKERSNAFYIDADNIEAYNCKILSSQDTLGRNGSANNYYHAYFKDCVIGGNTDYICGEFTAIFDNCELQWKTFANDDSNNGKVGMITAPKTSPYIFRNCTVTTSGLEGEAAVSGLYGRTWGKNSLAYFINTETNGYISASGWGEMGAGEGASSLFYEYNNTSNGRPFVSNGAFSKVLEDEAVIASMTSDDVINDYLNGWKPVSYETYEAPVGKLWGDVNGDGSVDVLDVSLTLDYTLQPEKVENFDATAADVSAEADGVNSEDVALILQKVLDGSFKLPVEGDGGSSEVTTEESTEGTTDATTETTTSGGGTEPVGDVTVYVVGDSTACYYGPESDTNYYYKRVGFGTGLESYINENAKVVNLALSGRSSKSFISEKNYQTLKDNIKEGDILIIAFGHNDEKSDDDTRYTDPIGDKDTAGSFKNSLYVNYVQLAQEKGATPILCSPIVRRTDSGTWSDSQLHKTNGGDYALCAKELAEEVGVPFIDLTGLTKAKYDELTPSKTVNLHAWTNSASTSVDNTHLNNYGAKEVAWLIATNAPDVLKPYIVANPAEPTEADLIVNPDYVEPSDDDLTGDALISKLWKTTAPWHGTVFGDIGGDGKLYATDGDGVVIKDQLAVNTSTGNTNFAITENSDGSVTVRAGEVKADDKNAAAYSYGKIAGTSDGLAMYYHPVDAASNYTIKAKAHVNGVANTNNQTAFGAIIADKVLVDENNKIMIDNYVAASPLKMVANVGGTDKTTGEPITAWGGYARINGTLTKGTTISTADGIPKAGDVIDVEITKVGNKFTVKYGTYESTFEVDMTGTMYVGLFAARCADITYTDISYNNEVVE